MDRQEKLIMRRILRPLSRMVGVIVLLACASIGLGAQSSGTQALTPAGAVARGDWTPPRTSWGDPDLQGVWDYRTITPLERPRDFGTREFLTADEAAALEKRAAKRLDEPPDETVPATTVHAPYWTDPGRRVLEDRRTSLIVDPPDGRIPALTPEGQARLAARGGTNREGGRADSYEDRSLLERCITWGMPTAILPGLYNNNIHIFQSPGYVAILHEMVHDVRIIPLERAHVGSDIRPMLGDSRGRWEGNTLVVETTNFSSKTNYRGSSQNLRLVERFTRLDADTIGFQVTVEDPTTWSKSWTAAFPMRPSEGLIYEYACHEGNYGLKNILEVARDEEKASQ
jgi:hypothetical protein